MADHLRVGIVGAGFMGAVHANAVRASGGAVTCVAGSSPESSERAARRLKADRPARSAEQIIESPDVDVVHICTPNILHAPLAMAALAAGKHVVCEKPLATTVADAEALAQAASASTSVTAVPFVYRWYPLVREARSRIAAGHAGRLHLLHGSYLQDWLASSTETNWRVDPARGGPSRAFGDIGVHWCDLMEFVTGHRIVRLLAHASTALPHRDSATGSESVETEDAATVIFETDQGAAGTVVLSQVSLGRKNSLQFSFDGTLSSYCFDQQRPDELWVGGGQQSQLILRGGGSLSTAASRYSVLPAGHPQGYQDCFNAFVSDVYAAIGGQAVDGMATFADGLRAAKLTAAVLQSTRLRAWVEVPS